MYVYLCLNVDLYTWVQYPLRLEEGVISPQTECVVQGTKLCLQEEFMFLTAEPSVSLLL